MNRKESYMFKGIVVSALCLLAYSPAGAVAPVIIPLVTDPSPVIDGDLKEWGNRGALRTINQPEQVGYGRPAWQGPDDLSGWVKLGHDDRQLFIACHVVDSFFSQTQSGVGMWLGDHVIGWVDFVRSGRKEDFVQFGLSSGSLRAPGSAGPNIKPEFVIWEPPGWSPLGASVAARRTEVGYDLEAAIPWTVFKVTPAKYQTFALEIALSDCDQTAPNQESCMSINTAPWNPADPKRFIPAGLADQTGFLPPGAFQETTTLSRDVVIEPDDVKEFVINVEKIPEAHIPTITFKARADCDHTGGCNGGLLTKVNGKMIQKENVTDRPEIMQFVSGGYQPSWYSTGVVLYYSPDFEAVEKSAYKPLDCKACYYTLRLDNLFKVGKNTISFQNKLNTKGMNIAMADLEFTWSPPSRFKPAKVLAPAPTGPLAVHEPWMQQKVDYKVTQLPGAVLKVEWQGKELTVESRFSRPGGALTPKRSIQKLDECVLVRDVLVNESKEILPVILSHRAAPGDYDNLWLSGRPVPMKMGATIMPENPSVVVLGKDFGFALMAHDDVFRIHCRSSCDSKFAELSDNSLALRPGVTYQHEWLIVPLPKPDYWHYVNAMRRYFHTNFTIPGSFAFFGLDHEDCPLLPWEITEYLDRKNAYFTSVDVGATYKGLFPHGPHERDLNVSKGIATNKTIRALRPETKLLSYFNCFDCARPEKDPVEWPDCRLLRPDGEQVRNGDPYPLYFPTLTNAYGKEMDQVFEWKLKTVGADGLYWDCYSNSSGSTHYGEPWDGWSVDIDPATNKIIRKRSSVPLISWEWRKKVTQRLLKEGRPLVANGNPVTTSEMKLHFPRFVETADISNLSMTHLYTPIALGDHITERNEVDAYRWMLNALDWGGLYYWYAGRIIPTHPTLTSYMFPFTPIEIHSGYLIGKERILTKVSGFFGWGDASQFEVHVFDRVGKETTEIKVPRVVLDGRTYAEVRLPEGYSVAIVRLP